MTSATWTSATWTSATRTSAPRTPATLVERLRRARLAAAALLTAVLAACDGGSAPNSPSALPPSTDAAQGGAAIAQLDKVSIQLNWVAEPEFGGFYAAEQKALFQAEGLEVTLVQGGPDVPAPQLVASGKVPFAIVAGPQIAELAEKGGDLVAIYSVYQGNPMGVMVHAESPYATLEALWNSDATIAIQQGLSDYKWLNRQFGGAKLRVVPYSSNLAQFAADKALAAQCFVTSEPVTLELEGVATRVFMIGDSGYDPYNCVLACRRDYFERNRDLCARLVKACAAGWRAYLDAPRPVNEAMARLNPAMKVEAMDKAAERQRTLVENDETKRLGLGGMRLARWQMTVDQLVEMGDLKPAADGGRVDATRFFHWDPDAGTAR